MNFKMCLSNKIFYLLLFCVAIILNSCDYISNPCPEKNANISDTASCLNPTFASVTLHSKKILIEDYTGHICPNCPRAARKLHIIDSTYPGRIIGLGVHYGSLAIPDAGFPHDGSTPAYAFATDFNTTIGNIYGDFFAINSFPNGMINRRNYNDVTLSHQKFYLNWQAYVAGIIGDSSVVDLQISTDYDASSNKLCCATKDSFLTNLSGNYRLVCLLVQDSIVDWQDDIDYPGNMDSSYVHRHVLRDAITPSGAWGESLISGIAATGLSQIRHFAYTIPSQYNSIPVDINKCYIIAFIYNTATYEIIQSEEEKIIH